MRRRLRHGVLLLALLALVAAPLAALGCPSGPAMAGHCCCGGSGASGCPQPERPSGLGPCPMGVGVEDPAAPVEPTPEPARLRSVRSGETHEGGAVPGPCIAGGRQPRPGPRLAGFTAAFQTVLPPPVPGA